MKATTNLNFSVPIAGDTLIRDLNSKALLSTDRQLLKENRYKRLQAEKLKDLTKNINSHKDQYKSIASDIEKVQNEVNSIKIDLQEIKALLLLRHSA
jgi:septal ring factor EnvC (AmiA/AmiB activator)